MAALDCLPFPSISDNELRYLLNNNQINLIPFSILVLDSMISNQLYFQQDENTNNNVDPLFYNPFNSTHKSSQYVHLSDYKAQPYVPDAFTMLSMNIRSLSSNLQLFTGERLSENFKFDVMAFSETRLDNYIESLSNISYNYLCTTNRDKNGGGVCLYVSNIHNSCVLPDCSYMET